MPPLLSRVLRTRRRAGLPAARRLAGRLTALCALGAAAAAAAACSDSTGPGGGGGGGGTSTSVAPPVGTLLRLNTQSNSACNAPTYRGGRVVAVSNRAIVVADTANPAGGFSDAEYQSIAATFDTLVYPVDTRAFGAPEDIDKNGRVIIFYTRAVNELTPPNVDYVIGGFFISRDLFPKANRTGFQGCAGSNEAELFYLLVPDPSGAINNNPRDKARVLTTSLSTVAHEFQHLINASRRLYVLNQEDYYEQVWLNEGLSHVAEEINFYESAGLSPSGQAGQSPRADLGSSSLSAGRTVTALNAYNGANLGRLSSYYKTVRDSTPFGLIFQGTEPDDDGLATRGAAWGFLRYAADRLNGDDATFFNRLVNGSTLGLPNLRAGLGPSASLEDWMRDWAVANFADNFAAAPLDERFQYRSWNFRTLLPRVSGNGGAYPLAVRSLTAGAARTDSVAGGTAAYYTFAVAGGTTAAVRVRGPGDAAPGSFSRLALVRVSEGDAGPAVTTYNAGVGDLSVTNASATPAQYALVAFNANLADPRAKLTLTVGVSGPGVTAAAAASAADALRAARAPAQAGPTIAGLRAVEAAANAPYAVTDLPLQERFRRQAEEELAGRVAGAQAWFRERRRQ